jgi:penicillin-binding protein-related factor A (putative recombinase)
MALILNKRRKTKKMIKFEDKLQKVNRALVAAVRDFVKYNKTDIQIVATNKDSIEHLVIQGGDLKEVNDVRKKAGLWAIEKKHNVSIMKDSFVEAIKKGDGVVFVLITGEKRRKIDKEIYEQIRWAIERNPSISFEIVENNSFDSIFFSFNQKSKKQVAKLPEELPVVDSNIEGNV